MQSPAVLHRRVVILAVAAAASLPLLVSLPGKPEALARLHDFAHAPFFAGIALALAWLLSGWSRPYRYVGAFIIAVFIGAGIELLQSVIGRSAQWSDLATDAAGAACGLLLAATFGGPRWRCKTAEGRIATGAAGLILLLIIAWPLCNAVAASMLRANRFPVLLQADTRLDAYFLRPGENTAERVPLPEAWRRPGAAPAYRVHLKPVKWSGISLSEPASDWRGYTTLVIELINPASQPLPLTLRIHDRHHDQRYDDRFNRSYELAPDARTVIRVPLEEVAAAPRHRRLDMASIDGLGLFSPRQLPPKGATFYLVSIRLE